MHFNDIFHDINNEISICCRTYGLKYHDISVHNIINDIYDIINGIIDIINNINDNFAISQTANFFIFACIFLQRNRTYLPIMLINFVSKC